MRVSPTVTEVQCVVVGDGAFSERIGGLLEQALSSVQVRGAGGYLMALGEVARHRPSVLVGSTKGLEESPGGTASALRELAPDALLLVVGGSEDGEVAENAVAAGFDGCVEEPVTSEGLGRAIRAGRGGLNRVRAVAPEVVRKGPKKPNGQAAVTKSAVSSIVGGMGDSSDGDGLLVEKLLSAREGLAEAALRLLVARSGVDDLQVSERTKDLPGACSHVRLEHGGQEFGVLWTGRRVEGARLAEMGRWLARWLALGRRMDTLWEQALYDDLTGVWNRRYFGRYLKTILERATQDRFRVTLMVYDIDDFKGYNDRYGHAAGDEILRETARLMRSVVREHDVVARIGGDEFAVIFWDSDSPRRPNSEHPWDVRNAAERFRKAVWSHRFPKLSALAPGRLTISGGLASFPWDGRAPDELLEQADRMAMQSKQQGKNAITLGPGASRDSVEDRSPASDRR